MKELTKEVLQNYSLEFAKLFGIDLEAKMKEDENKPSPIGEFFFSRDIFAVYKLASENKLIEALETFHELLQEKIPNIQVIAKSRYLKELSSELLELAGMVSYCEYHSNEILDQYVAAYKGYWLFEGNDIKKELKDLWIFPRIEKALGKKLFETYCYHKENQAVPPKESIFKLNPNLYIVDSINSFLRFAKREKIDSDEIRATYLLKIEDIPEYSYFVLVIQYKGNVWIGTDKMMFANPNNKYHRRNPVRSREEHFENLDLPYGIIDHIDEIRKSVKVPVPQAGFELHVLKMVEFDVTTKAYMHQLAGNLIENLQGQDYPSIASYEDVMLSLPAHEDIRSESKFESDDYEGVNDRVKEIQNMFKEEESKTTSLAIINKDIVLKSEHYDPEWLATPESLQNLNNWIANKEIAKKIQDKLEDLYPAEREWMDPRPSPRDRIEQLHKEFGDILQKHVNNILPYVLIADEIFIEYVNNDIAQFGSKWNRFLTTRTGGYYSIALGGSDAIYDRYYGMKGTCIHCQKHQESKRIEFCLYSARELQVLFGLKWEEIPDWFKLYRSSGLIPYHGNSILRNVDPLAMVEDNVSKRFPNGFPIVIKACGWCHKKFVKEYKKWQRGLIRYDMAENKIIEVIEYPSNDRVLYTAQA